MEDYTEVFVGIDVAKARNSIAVAGGGRGGEVRFLGEVDASDASMRRIVKRIAGIMIECFFAMRLDQQGTDSIASSVRSATAALLLRHP